MSEDHRRWNFNAGVAMRNCRPAAPAPRPERRLCVAQAAIFLTFSSLRAAPENVRRRPFGDRRETNFPLRRRLVSMPAK